jgi:hypothetical protein
LFASLHSGLLVRKGEAAPSAHAPAFPAVVPARQAPEPDTCAVERRDAESPPPPAPERPRLRLLEKAPAAPRRPALPTEAAGVRIELRLRRDQARRLAVAAARLGRRRGALAADALEAYLTVLGESALKDCGCFNGSRGESCCSA